MRLGIDLDGVVADFNQGWIDRYNQEFGTELHNESVDSWDGLVAETHFRSMGDFWHWARDLGDGSIFRHLDAYPGAIETLEHLDSRGHDIVILTSKPPWAVHETFAWIADQAVPTHEVHILDDKWTVACDVYLDDAPHILKGFRKHRPEATACRYVRPWNDPLPGVVDVATWEEFRDTVARLERSWMPRD
ncbi:MAG: hypothetical protein ACE5MI_09010 [Acidimicrobiia bacterium]